MCSTYCYCQCPTVESGRRRRKKIRRKQPADNTILKNEQQPYSAHTGVMQPSSCRSEKADREHGKQNKPRTEPHPQKRLSGSSCKDFCHLYKINTVYLQPHPNLGHRIESKKNDLLLTISILKNAKITVHLIGAAPQLKNYLVFFTKRERLLNHPSSYL